MNTINTKVRRQVNRALDLAINKERHESIPLGTISAILRQHGLVILQEDYTEWSGFILGVNDHDYFELAKAESLHNGFYTPLKNSMLAMSWYRYSHPSYRYEILAHLT